MTQKCSKREEPYYCMRHTLLTGYIWLPNIIKISLRVLKLLSTQALSTDGQTYLQDGRSEVPNGMWPLQIYGVNLTRLTPQAHFNPITTRYPNLTKHGRTDYEPHNVSCACTDRQTDGRLAERYITPNLVGWEIITYKLRNGSHHSCMWNMSRDMWFPTMWYFDMCKLRRACEASFQA